MLNTIDVLDDLEKYTTGKAAAAGVTMIEGVLEEEENLTVLHIAKDGTDGVDEFFTACKTLGVKLVAAVFNRLEEEDWDSRLEDSRANDDHEDIITAIEECKQFIGHISRVELTALVPNHTAVLRFESLTPWHELIYDLDWMFDDEDEDGDEDEDEHRH